MKDLEEWKVNDFIGYIASSTKDKFGYKYNGGQKILPREVGMLKHLVNSKDLPNIVIKAWWDYEQKVYRPTPQYPYLTISLFVNKKNSLAVILKKYEDKQLEIAAQQKQQSINVDEYL